MSANSHERRRDAHLSFDKSLHNAAEIMTHPAKWPAHAYLKAIDLIAHGKGVQVEGEEKLRGIPLEEPVAIWSSHTGDSDIYAIARVYDTLNTPYKSRFLVYSDYHRKNTPDYGKGVQACEDAGWIVKGVTQGYRSRVINPTEFPSTNTSEKAGLMGSELIEGMLKDTVRSFVFPTGTRNPDGTLLPAESALGMVIFQALQKKINLHLIPMAIIPQVTKNETSPNPHAKAKPRVNLHPHMKIIYGDPVTPELLRNEALTVAQTLEYELAKDTISIKGDRANKILLGLMAHVFMMHIPVPPELRGVYDPDSPYYEGVLRGIIKTGMRAKENGGYEVLLVQPNPDTSSETQWIAA